MRTAADFNREEEERLKKLAEKRAAEKAAKAAAAGGAEDNSQKKPKLNKAGKFICANKGCKIRAFTDEENGPEACNFHNGEPIFHDLKKYWSCCNPKGEGGKNRIGYDWDEFMQLDTCQVGPHQKKYP